MRSTLKILLAKPDLVRRKHYPLYSITLLICTAAILVSIVLLSMSFLFKSPSLAILSLIPFFGALTVNHYNRNGKHQIAITLMYVLTLLFSVFATIMFGWASGFQYFLIAQLVTFILYPHLKLKSLNYLGAFVAITFILLYWGTNNKPVIDQDFILIIHTFNASVCLFVITSANLYFRLTAEEQIDKYSIMANTDFLTGLFSRRRMDSELSKRFNLIGSDNKKIYSVILIDIDMFKLINDRFGNILGDIVLKQFSEFLKSLLSESELLARWGGDEFVILTESENPKHAQALAESVRASVKEHSFPTEHGEIKMSISCAVTQLSADKTNAEILFIADQLIRISKNKGGNTVSTQDSINRRVA